MMKCYRIDDIEWDADGDEVDANLPSFAYMQSAGGVALDELRDGIAADWLSDKYGYAVKSLSIEEVEAKMYTVYIRRTETYDLPVNVLARSRRDAIDAVRMRNAGDGAFDRVWPELQPHVVDRYDAAESECPDRGEGPLA